MGTLYVVRDGLESVNRKVDQISNSTFFLLTFDFKSNVGYIGKKSSNWRLYTSLGSNDDFDSRYHHFPTFKGCLEKLKKLCVNSSVELCDTWDISSLKLPPKEQNSLSEQIEIELKNLIGLNDVKDEIRGLIHFAQIRKAKIESELPINPPTLHLVFYGNPGTGKTMVARLIAKFYFQIGLIKTDNLIEVSRTDLVGQHIGETAIKTNDIFQKAIGGILFIDEAYSLYSESVNDFGHEAISTLIKLMEDYRNDIVVIAAGYTKQMNKLLLSNPGFKDRFSSFVNFKDYSKNELLLIIQKLFLEIKHNLTKGAIFKLELLIEKLFDEKYFKGNGRSARNLFDKILVNQSTRLEKSHNIDPNELSIITPDDIPEINPL